MPQSTRAMKRILWVDDEIDLLKPHLLFLQARNYHIDAISNGDDALELMREGPYDLVLLDEQMPGRSGLEVLEIMRRDREWNDDGARQALLALFDALGQSAPLTVTYRKKLSALLFS